MNTSEIFNHYAAMMDDMLQSNEFWRIYFQAPMPLYNEKDIPYPLKSGATRACLVDPNFPYVVKWDTLETGGRGCEQEETFYNDACYEELSQYFLEPIFLGTYQRIVTTYDAASFYDERGSIEEKYYPNEDELAAVLESLENVGCIPEQKEITIALWAYPRAESILSTIDLRTFSDEVRSSASSYYHDGRLMSEGCYCMWLNEVGEETFEKLHQFLLDEDINDLHCGNMMMYHGHLVFSDYAGI